MDRNEIQLWLDGVQDYHMGLALYSKYGKSKALKRLFAQKAGTKYNTEKMVYELTKIAGVPAVPVKVRAVVKLARKSGPAPAKIQPVPAAASTTLPAVFSESQFPKVDFQALPDQLKAETMTRIKLYQSAWIIHSKLGDELSDDQRATMASDIVTKMDEVNRLWNRIDHFLKTGAIPLDPVAKPAKEIGTDPLSQVKRQNNLRTYISRAKKKLETLTDSVKRSRIEENIAKWDLELDEIEKNLAKA